MRFSSTCCSDGFEVRQLPCKLMHKETTVGTAICEDRACITTRFWQLMLQSCSIKKVGFDFLPMVPFFSLCCKISMYLHCVSTPRNWSQSTAANPSKQEICATYAVFYHAKPLLVASWISVLSRSSCIQNNPCNQGTQIHTESLGEIYEQLLYKAHIIIASAFCRHRSSNKSTHKLKKRYVF